MLGDISYDIATLQFEGKKSIHICDVPDDYSKDKEENRNKKFPSSIIALS